MHPNCGARSCFIKEQFSGAIVFGMVFVWYNLISSMHVDYFKLNMECLHTPLAGKWLFGEKIEKKLLVGY
jgi:hypothetical protein